MVKAPARLNQDEKAVVLKYFAEEFLPDHKDHAFVGEGCGRIRCANGLAQCVEVDTEQVLAALEQDHAKEPTKLAELAKAQGEKRKKAEADAEAKAKAPIAAPVAAAK